MGMTADYEIGLATAEDIVAMLALQEQNMIDRGGWLSVRQTADSLKRSLLEMPTIVARRDGKLVGYLASQSLSANAHVPIIQAMLRAFPVPPDCYLYGPVCVHTEERGKGLARLMLAKLRERLPGRTAIGFIRGDNDSSLKAHRKMAMREMGRFTSDAVAYIAFTYSADTDSEGRSPQAAIS